MESPQSRFKPRYVLYAFAGLFALTAACVGFIAWKFTPLVQIDEKNQRLRLLGGWIQVDGRAGSMKIGQKQVDTAQNSRHFEGKTGFREFSGGHGAFGAENAQLLIRFLSGNLTLTAAPGDSLEWKCDVSPMGEPPQVEQVRSQMVLNLARASFGRCTVALPARLTVAVDARGGRIEVTQPAFDFRIDALYSKVVYRRDPKRAYRFETRLDSSPMTGLAQLPPPSPAADAVWAGITLRNGALELE